MIKADKNNSQDLPIYQNILFIGGGNITTALVSGLTRSDASSKTNSYIKHITIIDHNPEKLHKLKHLFNIDTINNLNLLSFIPDIIILAVKPFAIQTACQEIADYIKPQTVVISVAAGIPINNLIQWLPSNTSIIRAMPNTPAAIGQGMTILYNQSDKKSHNHDSVSITNQLFQTVGDTVWVNAEDEINMTMAIAGCGPAYILLLCENLMTAAEQIGISAPLAKKLICQTLAGSSELFKNSDKTADTLRNEVTSPKGTTAAAIEVLNPENMNILYTQALQAAILRAKTIERELTK